MYFCTSIVECEYYIMMDKIKFVEEQLSKGTGNLDFRPGDNVEVDYKIVEGEKHRIQTFRGNVIQINGVGAGTTFTVRKMSSGVGVERIFPLHSPHIAEVRILKKGKVRRAKLFYLRNLIGKKSRIKERSAY